jgi:hypothetical protein
MIMQQLGYHLTPNYLMQYERIKIPKRGVNWAFLKSIARIKSY